MQLLRKPSAKHADFLDARVVKGLRSEHRFAPMARKRAEFQPDLVWDLDRRPFPLPRDYFEHILARDVIEHVASIQDFMEEMHALLLPGATIEITTPHFSCANSFIDPTPSSSPQLGLLFAGHFTQFLGTCYPAHITALLRLDLARLCQEVGFALPRFYFTDIGGVPKRPSIAWQNISFGLLRGRLFSDNLCMVTRRTAGDGSVSSELPAAHDSCPR